MSERALGFVVGVARAEKQLLSHFFLTMDLISEICL